MKSILPVEQSVVGSRERNINVTTSLTPESIMQLLFSYRDIAHKFHLNCFLGGVGSFAEHKALNKLYEGIQDLQDSILEQMMGYLQSSINSSATLSSAPKYNGTQDSIKLCTAIIDFAKELQVYASSSDMPNIENLAQELSGLAAQTRYFLMFK